MESAIAIRPGHFVSMEVSRIFGCSKEHNCIIFHFAEFFLRIFRLDTLRGIRCLVYDGGVA